MASSNGNGETADNHFIDITSLIEDCAASLSVSEPFICNEESFSLHDAMAATQLMDRKMDCCEIPAHHYSTRPGTDETDEKVVFPRPTPSGIDDDFAPLPWYELTDREAAFISLELLVRLQAFLSGASVGESTFTCLYAHSAVLADMRSKLFGELPLDEPGFALGPDGTYAQFMVFTCALSVVEITEVVRGIIVNADVYEEEDFSPTTHDIPFYSDSAVHVNPLRVVEKAMEMTKEKDESQGDEQVLLREIIGYLFAFLSICSTMGKLSSASLDEDLTKMQRVAQMAVERLEQLEAVVSSRPALQKASDVFATLRRSFDSFLNRPLVGNTPIRRPMFQAPPQALANLKTIADEVDWAVCRLLQRGSSLSRIYRMLDRVQRSDVNIVSRSLIVLNLYFDEKLLGQYPLQALILEDMQQCMHVAETVQDSQHTRSFLSRLAKPIYDTLKLRTLNRCRQRAYMEAVMLHDWVTLESEARVVDVHLRSEHATAEAPGPPVFTQYVVGILIRIMDHHLSTGIEMGLYYGYQDVSLALWYRDFLLSAQLNHMAMMRQSKVAAQSALKPADKGRSKKRNVKTKQKSVSPKPSPEEKELEHEMILVSVKRDLCRGLKRFLAALQQVGILEQPEYRFTSLERVFEERFELFSMIRQPPPLTYQDYVKGSDFSDISPASLLATAGECFQDSKKTIERLLQDLSTMDADYVPLQEDELRRILKVCIGNSVYLLKLQSLADKQKTSAVLEFAGQSQFCTIKLL